MSSPAASDWFAQNQHSLQAALGRLRALLQRAAQERRGEAPAEAARPDGEAAGAGSALAIVGRMFSLSPFELDILLLAAGVELDGRLGPLCAAASGEGGGRAFPTFSLALAALPGAHWDALSPQGPLRRWRLIEVADGPSLTQAQLRVSERVLHYLAGVPALLDERLACLVREAPPARELVPSHGQLVAGLVALWRQAPADRPLPVVQLLGADRPTQLNIGAALCQQTGRRCFYLPVEMLPAEPAELDLLSRLWERDAALMSSALVLDCTLLDGADGARSVLITRFIEQTQGALVLIAQERGLDVQRPIVTRLIQKPSLEEQSHVWRAALGPQAVALNGALERVVSQFNLSAPAIRAISAQLPAAPPAGLPVERVLWQACREEARPRLDDLAQRVETGATWDDLVLPERHTGLLREIAQQVRSRSLVYQTWGMARGVRGLGISVLFAGSSGTGKTMAAEVLARDLELDLYRVDLSQVVSKYIGETEKNLRRIFDAAEEGGAVLLFDEADALFGKRSDVKDSHDRYANIEVSYLLQRMELYRGLAILTTNLKQALDQAFLRRLRFVVQFPFPDSKQRRRIWMQMLGAESEGRGALPWRNLDFDRLAQLNVAGGNIRNIVLNAAFLAAADPERVLRMSHLQRAAHVEYAKIEQTLTQAELQNWPDD